MTTGTLHDRRQFAQQQLEAMASQPSAEHPSALRQIAASVLGFTPVNDVIIAVDHAQLPTTATVIGTLTNEFGPDYLAVHLDPSTRQDTDQHDYVTLAQVQAANDAAQRYAGEERYPLLVFTLPNGSGVQFVTGNPTPGNRYRLQDIIRVTAYWKSANRTALDCLDQVGNAIASGGIPQRAFHDVFNVQPVTDEFFRDYKAAYDHAVGQLATSIERTDAEQFTQTLFNRLLFIHFVSRKGWLRFNGNADYLNALWRDYQTNKGETNFYLCRLSTLFFAGLNNPQSLDLMRDNPVMHSAIGDVPFLNGGLFEPTPLDDQAANGIFTVPDAAVAPLLNDLFNRYNFTVMEATPLDTEVAVDPEMLGKLFEETVNQRHSNGAYYTPRPVVVFMCREAIKGYLASREISDLTDDMITDLVDKQNPNAITRTQAPQIHDALKTMRTVDPACGSGAFLLGMLQEILAVNDSLFRATHTAKSLYEQKLEIITNNIYGADKDALAVSTAMLRLWLSLAVDYDGDEPPAPLPNLDLKLVAGDAVAGPDPQQFDFTREIIVQSNLHDDIAAYTTAHGPEKAALKQRLDNTKAELRSNLNGAAPSGVVEWRIDFADVMLHGGFDVVIANPPYVRHEDITPKSYKDALSKAYASAATNRSDLFCYFYARGLQLLRDGGIHVFICSNSWLDVGYGAQLQEHLLQRSHVKAIYESAVQRQFATADINTVITVIRKPNSASDEDPTQFISLRSDFNAALDDPAKRRSITKTRADLRAAGTKGRKFVGDKWGGRYLRAPDIYHTIVAKYARLLTRLDTVATVRRGITTGANEFFYLSSDDIASSAIEPEFWLPVMTTPQESRTIAVATHQLPKRAFVCHRTPQQLQGSRTIEYIRSGENQGFHLRDSTRSRKQWYTLNTAPNATILLNKMIDTTSRAFLTEGDVIANNVLYEVNCNRASDIAVCASLNSTLGQLMINIEGRVNFGGGMLELARNDAQNVLIVDPRIMPPVARDIFLADDWDVTGPSQGRAAIDDIVMDSLGMTGAEARAVADAVHGLVADRKRRAASTRRTLSD